MNATQFDLVDFAKDWLKSAPEGSVRNIRVYFENEGIFVSMEECDSKEVRHKPVQVSWQQQASSRANMLGLALRGSAVAIDAHRSKNDGELQQQTPLPDPVPPTGGGNPTPQQTGPVSDQAKGS